MRRANCSLCLLQRASAKLLVFLCLMISLQAQAFTIHYDTTRAQSLRQCDHLQYSGKAAQASRCYESLLLSNDSLIKADAAAALGDVRMANKLYREAATQSADPAIKTHWAKLYLETHQTSDAEALFREALLHDESYLPARIGLAQALSQGFEGQARKTLQEIISEHPSHVGALILLARIELELQNLAAGRKLLNRALAEVESQSLPPLEIYALHAAAELLEDKSQQAWIDRALKYNPSYGDVYAIPAHFYIITYRYREAVDLYYRAVSLDPDLASAHRDLGINQLRINNLFAARYYLQKAYELDPYDAQTVNTLRLLDGIDEMRVSSIDVPDPDDSAVSLGRVLIRLDREDADALEPYVIDMARRAVQLFSKRYDFTLQRPMVVELYHDHDDFGVRTVSTPGIGLLGVTFGYLTAMDSPKARAAGDFHWGSTLWHEIAHVFTLEATGHRLPRWFSEGLSVYEEWNTGPLADRELSLDVLSAIRDGQLLPIAQLDQGFVRPQYNGQVQVSYMQAGLICDFISSRWGHKALVSMLKAFAKGDTTQQALDKAIGENSQSFDQRFKKFLNTQYGDLLEALDKYGAEVQQLERALQNEDWVSAEALARDLIRLYPQRVGSSNAYQVLAKAQQEQGNDDAAMQTLLQWHALGGHEPQGLIRLIEQLREAGQHKQAVDAMESLNWVMPYGTDIHRWLGEYYLEQQQPALAHREFNALLGMQVDDIASAHLGKARAALLEDDPDTARRQVLYSLESAPFYRPAQRLLLTLSAGE